MPDIPDKLISSLQNIEGFDEQSFLAVHQHGEKITSIRLNPLKADGIAIENMESVPWSSNGYYLSSRPSFTLDPLLHGGAYYVQEASSMFLEQCITQYADLSSSLKVLDLCAAPGGKSTLIQSLLNESSLLVSNEVIKPRVNVLIENLSKWGSINNIVTNNDPRDFAKLPAFFDVMVVDAPCSGSGLFRRDPEAIHQWSTEAVEMCSLRQQRILSDAWNTLKEEGLLIYSTCSYSAEENEKICDWIVDQFNAEPLMVKIDERWNIVTTRSDKHAAAGYRFFPDKIKGEGFFIACFRKKDGGPAGDLFVKKNKINKLTTAEKEPVNDWLKDPSLYSLFMYEDHILAFPAILEKELNIILSALYVKKAGVIVGKLIRQELIPSHELAVSVIVNDGIPSISLKKEEALQYLRKEEVKTDETMRGWALVKYNSVNIGWIKVLGNRINNYYPKEWRILKTGNS